MAGEVNFLEAYEEAHNSKDYDEAIEIFTSFIDDTNNTDNKEKLAEACYYRGLSYAQTYDIDNAIKDIQKADDLGFDKAKIYCARGIAYAHNGDNEDAISSFSEAIKIDENNYELYYRRGLAYLFHYVFNKSFKDSIDLSIKDFDKSLELYPINKKVYYYKGVLYNEIGKYDNAIKNYDKAIDLDSEYIAAYNDRGLAYNNLGKYDKAIKLDKSLALAYNNRGLAYNNLGEYDKAIENYDKAIELDDSLALAYDNKRIAYYHKGILHCKKDEYNLAIDNFIQFNKKSVLYSLIQLLLKDKKTVEEIVEIIKTHIDKLEDEYFEDILDSLKDKEDEEKLLEIWIYQYILLDFLSLKNYTENVKEVSHYREKRVLDILLGIDEKIKNAEPYIRKTSISNANDPKEGEILKEMILNNAKKNIKIQKEKDYVVLQTSFIRYTDSLTMYRLYGKEDKKEGTGICFVFDKNFFNTADFLLKSPSDGLGNSFNKKEEYKKCIQNNRNYSISNITPFVSVSINYNNVPSENKEPLYFILYYDRLKNQLIFNPTDSFYKNEIIDLGDNNKQYIAEPKEAKDFSNNISVIFKEIFRILESIKNDEVLNVAYKLLINIRYLIKHAAFFEEQELRLISLEKVSNISIDKTLGILYENYEVDIFKNGHLKKIILGPKIEKAHNLREKYQYEVSKKNNDDEVTIEISDLPLN